MLLDKTPGRGFRKIDHDIFHLSIVFQNTFSAFHVQSRILLTTKGCARQEYCYKYSRTHATGFNTAANPHCSVNIAGSKQRLPSRMCLSFAISLTSSSVLNLLQRQQDRRSLLGQCACHWLHLWIKVGRMKQPLANSPSVMALAATRRSPPLLLWPNQVYLRISLRCAS